MYLDVLSVLTLHLFILNGFINTSLRQGCLPSPDLEKQGFSYVLIKEYN
jgi:hypothetical protein